MSREGESFDITTHGLSLEKKRYQFVEDEVHGSDKGLNSISPVDNESQWVKPSTRMLGKSPLKALCRISSKTSLDST